MSRWLMLGVFILASSPVKSFAEDVKLGYVDLQRALNETEDGRNAKASLKKIFDHLDKKRTLMPPDKVREKEAELQGRMQKVQQTYLRHQQDLQAKEQEATGKIFERMNRIIAKIAGAENFTMIFDKTQSAVLYAKPHLDLTNDLIRRYNGGEGVDKGATASAPKPKK
jgi:outer membrane protein